MKLTPFLLLGWLLLAVHARAAEFRFVCLSAGTTGLDHFVYDSKGKETAVILTNDSDPVAHEILAALIQKQVFGTKGVEIHEGVSWEQAIILTGEFVSKEGRTEKVPQGVPLEPGWGFFRVSAIKVKFPVSRFKVADGADPIEGPVVIETHFGFDSLFPEGVALDKRPIDLSKHVVNLDKAQ